jgi:DNA adenine methylase
MANLLSQIRRANGLGNLAISEPFCGGAGASLTLLYLEEAHEIFINDIDNAMFAFWWTLTNRPQPFLSRLRRTRVSMAEWQRQRTAYRDTSCKSKVKSAFAAFYLNRCNRSGIIMNGGPIGGIKQTGKWKLGARYNKPELLRRCEKIVEYRNRIHASCEDGIQHIKRLDATKTFFFIDPPYFAKGPTLYLNGLDESYHADLAEQLRAMSNEAWVLTYDDCPQIRKLYAKWTTIRPFSLRYAAAERRQGREIMIVPKWMQLPRSQTSEALRW